MNIAIILLTIADVFIAMLLIALILVQQSKSSGLGTTFGGGGSDSLFGAHAGSHLSKLTVVFSLVFLVITLSLAVLTAHRPGETSAVEATVKPLKANSTPEREGIALPQTKKGDTSASLPVKPGKRDSE